jgi:hypothetical protein
MGPITITVHKSVLVTIQGEWPRLLEVEPGGCQRRFENQRNLPV